MEAMVDAVREIRNSADRLLAGARSHVVSEMTSLESEIEMCHDAVIDSLIDYAVSELFCG